MTMKELTVIGRSCLMALPEEGQLIVPAKIDTGADTSSIWASNVYIDDHHILHFTLFDKGAEWYTGREYTFEDYSTSRVRSSNGQDEIRYSVRLPIIIAGRRLRATFTLADRSKNAYPTLIGRRALYRKFLVDVSQDEAREVMGGRLTRQVGPSTLLQEMKLNPKAFYEKYHGNKEQEEML